jgi:general secretion pathway protein K
VSRSRERGVALVAAAVALALLVALATGLAHTTVVDQHLARHALAGLQAEALARSGVAAAAVLLRESAAAGTPDTLRAPWIRASGRQPLGPGWVEVTVEDEARRLDLDLLADAVPALLRTLALDPRLAEALADWTDADDVARPGGAERGWYLARPDALLPRNAPLRTVGELGAVRGFDPAALERVRPHVTVAGEPAVNPNTASREVLLALGADAAAVDRLLAARVMRPLAGADFAAWLPGIPTERLTARGRHYTVRVVADAGGIRRAREATLEAPGGVDATVVAWRPLRPP